MVPGVRSPTIAVHVADAEKLIEGNNSLFTSNRSHPIQKRKLQQECHPISWPLLSLSISTLSILTHPIPSNQCGRYNQHRDSTNHRKHISSISFNRLSRCRRLLNRCTPDEASELITSALQQHPPSPSARWRIYSQHDLDVHVDGLSRSRYSPASISQGTRH